MASKDHKATLKTVKKWEKEFDCSFEYELDRSNVTCLRCTVCKRWEKRIDKIKGFSLNWIRPGTKSIKKDGVKTHCHSVQHKEAVRLDSRSKMGALPYMEHVVNVTPIGRGLKKMCSKDMTSLRIKFNTAYYLAKAEKPYSDYSGILELQSKNELQGIGKSYITDRAASLFIDVIGNYLKSGLQDELKKVRFFSILSDGSADSANIEEEVIYFLYLSEGIPKLTFLSIEDTKNADANGLMECIVSAFKRFDKPEFQKHLLGLNVDGASVNMGIHGGLGALLKVSSPWLQVIHCFNHRLELAVKDAFKTTTFGKIDEMLNVMYQLYKTSAKRLRELKRFADAWEVKVTNTNESYRDQMDRSQDSSYANCSRKLWGPCSSR